ncbi:hypothetical protein QUF80_02190 [Desulfococcaceae bacterium HSG8]|nr:hypothetical protein [Desulfococcaceae bacterium HSG8]
METEEKHIETITLENNLILKLYDGSRIVAGDRWVVKLIARTDIPVNRLFLNETDLNVSPDEIKKALGENVIFKQERERNFIHEQEKDKVFKMLYDSFSDSSLSYLSHADFPKRFVLKKYQEHIKRAGYYHDKLQG